MLRSTISRYALDWLFETKEVDWSLRLCVALFRFWDMREHLTEGRARLEHVLNMAGRERSKEELGFRCSSVP